MKITRINKIKGYRAFQDYEWHDLPDFGRFNLIYGWNGSGKTTLSNLFRHIQSLTPITGGLVEFHIDGKPVQGDALTPGMSLPRIRVFNRDLIQESIGRSSLSPIFFLGADSVEKQRQLVELRANQDAVTNLISVKDTAIKAAENALDKFCIKSAAAIKDLLKSSGQNIYNNYDKSNFKKGCLLQVQSKSTSVVIDEKTKVELRQQKDGIPKDKIELLSLTIPDVIKVLCKSEALLQKTVASQIIDELIGNVDLAEWVRTGIPYHTGAKATTQCHFCGSHLLQERLARLEAHFNDAYNKFIEDIDTAIQDIEIKRKLFADVVWPVKAELYSNLTADYVRAKARVISEQNHVKHFMDKVKDALISKRQKPFDKLEMSMALNGAIVPDTQALAQAIDEVHSVINRHNKTTDDFQKEVIKARATLENCYITETLADYNVLTANIRTLNEEKMAADNAKVGYEAEIATIERDIVEHRRPAEQLNEELHSYLGQSDLTFSVKEAGYEIARNGQIATDLSEGERTAIAFLYFLKSLQDKNFTINTDIVVIDDPVSSLDTNALFSAFGYMKARTKEVGQLFVLTHNYNFFCQVKDWFNHEGKSAKYYMVEAGVTDGKRNCSLRKLDELLQKHKSEYHYLFKRVYEEANKAGNRRTLEEYYYIPNIARRLLESFFSFRYPQESGLYKQLVRVDTSFEPAKTARIMRFVHTYSHDESIGESGHDLSLLAETPQIMKEIIELIKHQDLKHFEEMEKIVKSSQSSNN